MQARKTLIILRHGQARNAGISEHDHSRHLTEQGREEAAGAGELLAGMGLAPDIVLCSTAVRTRETMAGVQSAYALPFAVTYSQRIYNASEADLLNQVSAIEENTHIILIIGHNPGLYQLALSLAKDGDKQMHNNLQMQFPTCALAVINFEGEWKNIASSRSKLTLFATPERHPASF